MKRALITRLGAFGDVLIITPIIRELKKQGFYVMVHTSERGVVALAHNPNVDEIKYHIKDSVPMDRLGEYFAWLKKEYKVDRYINLTQSIEHELAILPQQEELYKLENKQARLDKCNINYYESSMRWAMLDPTKKDLNPELFFTKDENIEAKKLIDLKKFNILWGLIGSGHNKFYPWAPLIINEIKRLLPNVNVITVGDDRCRDIESLITAQTTKLSGKVSMRTSMCLTKYVDLVIAPDTGLLHASGCYPTPKIGLLGHTTIENITKHFTNDYSLEAIGECAPCMRMIYDFKEQCVIDEKTGACDCMGAGITPQRVIDTIKKVYNKARKNRRN